MIQAAVFDLYETLVTELDPHWHESRSLWARLGVERDHFWDHWRATYEARMCGRTSLRETLQSIAMSAELTIDPVLLDQLCKEEVEAKRTLFQTVHPPIISMLQQLRDRGLKLGLISNAGAEEIPDWERSPLRTCFDAAVFSFEIGLAKPNPGIYQTCLDRLGISAASAIFVGDGGSSELTGAQRMGMRPMWATWFLRRWPAPRLQDAVREGAGAYPEVCTCKSLIERVEALRD